MTSERTVFEQLLRTGQSTRAELAKTTGLSAPTVGKVVDDLLATGLLEEAGEGRLRVSEEAAMPLGRPGRLVRVNQVTPRFVAVQVGVRHTRLAALPVAGPLDESWPIRFRTPRTVRTWAARLDDAAKELRIAQPWAVTMSVPGVLDEVSQRSLLTPNLRWLEKANLPGCVTTIWDAPLCMVQEIRALALGHLACEPEAGDYLLVDVGEGVGGAAVIGGKLHGSPLPLSGELGHTPAAGNDRPCGCGGIGCVETLVSRGGLLASFAQATRKRRAPRPTWRQLARHVEQNGVQSWLDSALEALAISIAGAINVLGLRQVVITGALTELSPVVLERLGGLVSRSAMWARFGSVTCVGAPRRRAAGLVVAAIDRVLFRGYDASQHPSLAETRP